MEKTISIIDALKVLFATKGYIDSLCEYYGEPEGVIQHLREVKNKYPVLKSKVMPIMEEQETYLREEVEYRLLQNHLAEESRLRDNRCVNCDWGNGEGGCTIPYCCFDNEE